MLVEMNTYEVASEGNIFEAREYLYRPSSLPTFHDVVSNIRVVVFFIVLSFFLLECPSDATCDGFFPCPYALIIINTYFSASTDSWKILKSLLHVSAVARRLSDTRCEAQAKATSSIVDSYEAIRR